MIISPLTICGMMTQNCVGATTRAAKDFGFDCSIIADACTTRDLPLNGEIVGGADIDKSTLAALSLYYAAIV